ncbi:MAG: DUF4365 domain-containing protein [bacterium]|nr:DUF4365 domain-containing protein [bacterium]
MREIPASAVAEEPSELLAVLERKIEGHGDWIRSVKVSPDSTWAVSGSNDRSIKIWNLETGACQVITRRHSDKVRSVTITPDGTRILSAGKDRTVRIWNLSRRTPTIFRGHTGSVWSVSVAASGGTAISSAFDRTVVIWNLYTLEVKKRLIYDEPITCAAAFRNDKNIISGSESGRIRVRNISGQDTTLFTEAHSERVNSIAITKNEALAISGSADKTIRFWNLESGRCLGILEGHQNPVDSVAISPDGTLIASTGRHDQTVRLWDFQSALCMQSIELPYGGGAPISIAFRPDQLGFVVGTTLGSLYIYSLTGTRPNPAANITRRYVNAKVVLLGESGVGKSGLAHRLIEDEFVQTHSTHGMQVWPLDLPIEEDEAFEREALLWDLAGQEDYRLIHQLFLDETALALMLVNPQKDDPFAEAGDWEKALSAAVPRDVAKLLIAARVDVGGVRVSRKKIDRFLEKRGYAGYLETSAKRGDACSDDAGGDEPSALKRMIAEHIPWADLPWTSTPRLLAELKTAVLEITEEVALLRFAGLEQRLRKDLPGENFGESDVRTAVTLLSNHGLVQPFDFGDLVLLKPHLLNGYAAAVIRAARAHTDEIGCVAEADVFDRSIDLEGVERLKEPDEDLLLRAMVQTFLDRSLCIAETTSDGKQLIFPSQYRREREIAEYPDVYVSYTFSGELATVYTTLVVRLWYSQEFENKELWKDAAELVTSKGHVAGLVMKKTGEGVATLSVFFEVQVPDELKVVLIHYVHQHLRRFAREVTRDRRYVCPNCGKPVMDQDAVRRRLAAKRAFIYCQVCDEKVPLIDHIERRLESDPVAREVLRMDEVASLALDTQAKEQILIGHLLAICGEANQIFRPTVMADYGIDGEVEFRDDEGNATGRKIYVQLKSGRSYLRLRKRDQKMIFDAPKARHLEYWTSQNADVYLVIYDVEKTILWMNVTAYLETRKDKKSRQIVFTGDKLDAAAVLKTRERHRRKR